MKTIHLSIIIATGISTVIVFALFFLQPLQEQLTSLELNTGTITFENQKYHFVTPNYTDDAYYHPVQISFHDVVFTLFPSGFRGGLPDCGSSGTYQYYWVDAKFSDNTHELLHILGASPPCPENPIPSMFSSHTNPQAGLIFYDGKMKLLVSTVNSSNMESTRMNQSLEDKLGLTGPPRS
ncbi:MAG: hypothetical protein KGH76_01370 [Thaumarchaeota archaeon]|nr:hypothetical protein [Nitrososphaerota archaeon]MDE1843628.1 hypothetical protein [Nitrososphaerota archaeon]